jgi:hypothetical protein
MQPLADAEENRAAELTSALRPEAAWRLASVEALPGFRLHVVFNDGTEGAVEMAGLIQSPAAGVFAALREEARFREARIVFGAVCWPGDLDLAPDAMYRAIRERGTWIV